MGRARNVRRASTKHRVGMPRVTNVEQANIQAQSAIFQIARATCAPRIPIRLLAALCRHLAFATLGLRDPTEAGYAQHAWRATTKPHEDCQRACTAPAARTLPRQVPHQSHSVTNVREANGLCLRVRTVPRVLQTRILTPKVSRWKLASASQAILNLTGRAWHVERANSRHRLVVLSVRRALTTLNLQSAVLKRRPANVALATLVLMAGIVHVVP